MSLQYDEYLTEHIANVTKGLLWMQDNLGGTDSTALSRAIENAAHHDASKYDIEEYDAYDQYFYGGNRSYQVVQDFNYAWLDHQKKNPHHWQYWVLINDDAEEGDVALRMPLVYIYEMIADWWTFSWKSDNLMEMFKWYGDHRSHIMLHPETRVIVEDILKRMWNILLMTETLNGKNASELEREYVWYWAEKDITMESNPEPVPDVKSTLPGIGMNGVFGTSYANRFIEEMNNIKHSDSVPIGKVISAVETKNGLEVTVKHSDTEDDEDLYGVPELKKFPMPDKKHVKSAIRFFNYVDPKFEQELAEAILEKAKAFGLDLENDISVGDENRFKKYLPKKEKADE